MVNIAGQYIQEPDAVTLETVLQKGLSPTKWFAYVCGSIFVFWN